MQTSLYSDRTTLFLQMLRDARLTAGKTQTQLALALHVDQTVISKSERGVRRLDVVELHAWLSALGVPLLDFVAALDDGLSAIAIRNAGGRSRQR
ncbi:MAG: helix-turn-helix transcriptional regulator [Burkholderiales bacterium]